MSIRRGNLVTSLGWQRKLMVVNADNQVLCCHRLLVLWNNDGASDSKCLLDKCRSNSYHSLNGNSATLANRGQLRSPSCCWEIRIKVRVSQTPTPPCKVKPMVRWRKWDSVACSLKRSVEEIHIGNVSSHH